MNRQWVDCTCCGAVAAYDDEYGYFVDGQSLLCGCTGHIEANEGHVEVNANGCWCEYPAGYLPEPIEHSVEDVKKDLKACIELLMSPPSAPSKDWSNTLVLPPTLFDRLADEWPPMKSWVNVCAAKPIDKDDFGDDEKTEPLPEIDWEALRKQYGTWAAKGNKTTTSSGPVDGWDNLDYMEPGVPIPPPPDLKDVGPALTTDANGKVVCDCGSTKLGSDMHSDWCSLEQLGIKP